LSYSGRPERTPKQRLFLNAPLRFAGQRPAGRIDSSELLVAVG
jgi:hypothetical protein